MSERPVVYEVAVSSRARNPASGKMTLWAEGDYSVALRDGCICEECGWPYSQPTQRPSLNINRGTAWPDFILSSDKPRRFHISERVVDDMKSNGISGYMCREIGHITVTPGRLQTKATPAYFDLFVTDRIRVDWKGVPRLLEEWCPRCAMPRDRQYASAVDIKLPFDYSDWTTNLLLPPGRGFSPVFCDMRFYQLAISKEWTGVIFHPVSIA